MRTNSTLDHHTDIAPRGLSLPSWAVSLVVHVVLLFLFFTTFRPGSWNPGSEPDSSGEYRDVGLVFKDETLQETPQEMEDPVQKPVESLAHNPNVSFQPPLEDLPPQNALQLPNTIGNVIGPGEISAPPLKPSQESPLGTVRPSKILKGDPNPLKKEGETEFFGIRDQGTSIVYVLDCSESMSETFSTRHLSPFYVAKSELLTSLQALSSKQSFQVIQFNNKAHPLLLRGAKKPQLYVANSSNMALARHQIDGFRADGGTNRKLALSAALELHPDVIYLLTDVGSAGLAELELVSDVARMNKGSNARIHCIEFGKHGESPFDNFLKKIARQNRGSYRYQNISSFKR